MAVAFEELDGSPEVSVDIISGDASATRMFKIAWLDYPQFFIDLCGQWVTTGTTSTYVPASVNFPGWPSLIVNTIKVKKFKEVAPVGKSIATITADTNAYSFAGVEVGYKPRQAYNDSGQGHHPGVPNVPNGTVLEVASKLHTEALSIPNLSLYYRNGTDSGMGLDNQLMSADTSRSLYLANNGFNLRWSRVPAPPWSAMRAIEGTVNSVPFLGYDVGHVLFDGADRDASFQINGTDLWTIVYNFAARSQKWNQTYIPKVPTGFSGWKTVVDAGNNPLFSSSDFAPLFSFGS